MVYSSSFNLSSLPIGSFKIISIEFEGESDKVSVEASEVDESVLL